jgi:hypothetical protein
MDIKRETCDTRTWKNIYFSTYPPPTLIHLSHRFTCASQLPAHAGSSLADFSTLKMEAIRSSETSVQSTTSIRRHTREDGILHSHRRENLKSYELPSVYTTPQLFTAEDFYLLGYNGA